jgi:hypothetical protein
MTHVEGALVERNPAWAVCVSRRARMAIIVRRRAGMSVKDGMYSHAIGEVELESPTVLEYRPTVATHEINRWEREIVGQGRNGPNVKQLVIRRRRSEAVVGPVVVLT